MLSRFNYGKYKDFVEAVIDLGRSIAVRKLYLFFRSILMAVAPNKQLKNICVLSRFNYDKYKEFVKAAIDLN